MTLRRSRVGMTGFLVELARQSKKDGITPCFYVIEPGGTPMSQAHTMLEKAAGKGRVISRSRAVRLLLSSPGFTFGKGETAMSFLKSLHNRRFVTLGKNRVKVERWGCPCPQRRTSQP